MITWYKFNPIDTLFFRGAEPMVMGESHISTPVFPPSTETILGALRTAVLKQNDIDFNNYRSDSFDDRKIIGSIGRCSDKNPFNVIGPLFKKNNKIFAPAPYCWFMDSSYKAIMQKDHSAEIKVIKPFRLETSLIKTSKKEILWAKPQREEVVSVGGYWVRFDDLNSNKQTIEIFTLNYFVNFEPRTGIALEDSRKVRESHIYSFNHIRLNEDVYLFFGVDKDLPLQEKGILKLGAEQRFGEYEKIDESPISFTKNSNGYFMALSIVPKSNEANNSVVATGKPIYLGGWDLAKGFHKPMIGYFPAGSVFSKKLDENFIPIN